MSAQDVQDWIGKQIAGNDVVLFMKGTKSMPQCGLVVCHFFEHGSDGFGRIGIR